MLGSLGLGLIVYAGQWLLEPGAMRREQGAQGAAALVEEPAAGSGGEGAPAAG